MTLNIYAAPEQEHIVNKARDIAEQEHRSLSQIVMRALEAYVTIAKKEIDNEDTDNRN